MKNQITVREFEQKVREIEEITIVIRAPRGAKIDDYDYVRKAADNTSISDWMESRVKPCLNGYEIDVVSPDYVADTPHGRTKMGTLREQYER